MPRIDSKVTEVSIERPGAVPEFVQHSREPLVLRGLVSHWPLVEAGGVSTNESINYLEQFCLDQNIVVFRGQPDIGGRFFYNEDLSGFNFSRSNASLKGLLSEFASNESVTGASSLYVGSTPVNQCFPGMLSTNSLDIGEVNALASIWMGTRTRIAAHFDYPDNVAAVAAGRRRFVLFPPEQVENLYVGPVDFTPAGQAISLVDFENPDYERFPRYREAIEHAQVAELQAGDAIFIPSLWWHQVEGLDDFNILINYWWRSVSVTKGNPMDALIHCLLTFNGMPVQQREAWRNLFDYYLFNGEVDNGSHSHIPDSALGILGDIDEASAAQLRAMLRSRLGG